MDKRVTDKSLRERIAKVLKWEVEDTCQFSFPTLRSLVQSKDPNLYLDIDDYIKEGNHLFHND